MSAETDTTTIQVSRETHRAIHQAHAEIHGALTKQRPLDETVRRAIAELEADDDE
jgi:hypothetical protein